jgi:hypothetical protein
MAHGMDAIGDVIKLVYKEAARFGRGHTTIGSSSIPMPSPSIAIASAKSFGDFVIAHSVLRRVETSAKSRIRMISCGHVKHLLAALPDDVPVTLVDSDAERVPALFDVKKCGALAAMQSAISLRAEFRRVERRLNEVLAFDTLGVREKFIAGRWPTATPRERSRNIYETYSRFLAEQEIRTDAMRPPAHAAGRSVGIFPESRLVEKRLGTQTVSTIFERAAMAGFEATLFVLDGDLAPERAYPRVVHLPRRFASLVQAIRSVDRVISADSLPAHLGEYYSRSVFVAKASPNEYWLPHACFEAGHWGIFHDPPAFSAALDDFFRSTESISAPSPLSHGADG